MVVVSFQMMAVKRLVAFLLGKHRHEAGVSSGSGLPSNPRVPRAAVSGGVPHAGLSCGGDAQHLPGARHPIPPELTHALWQQRLTGSLGCCSRTVGPRHHTTA